MRFPLGSVACAGAIIMLFGATLLEAQFDNGQISGFVRDGSGAVVPGVVVTATNEGNRQQREAVSNETRNLPVVELGFKQCCAEQHDDCAGAGD